MFSTASYGDALQSNAVARWDVLECNANTVTLRVHRSARPDITSTSYTAARNALRTVTDTAATQMVA